MVVGGVLEGKGGGGRKKEEIKGEIDENVLDGFCGGRSEGGGVWGRVFCLS